MPAESRCIVQFIHPGEEHAPDRPGVKEWNRSDHKRKFMTSPGRYLDQDGVVHSAEIVFWGEWEPESHSQVLSRPEPDGPSYLYKPFYRVPEDNSDLQNTDPFVFGDRFCYTICQQKKKVQLRRLSSGSLVLFGSCKDSSFVLDTVFVTTDDHIDHNRANYKEKLRGQISDTYRVVTIEPYYSGDEAQPDRKCGPSRESVRLYFGAAQDAQQDGMFSFFPCQPSTMAPQGFARPVIRLPDYITQTLTQGVKITPNVYYADAQSVWNQVVRQVREQGLQLGIFAEMPPRKTS